MTVDPEFVSFTLGSASFCPAGASPCSGALIIDSAGNLDGGSTQGQLSAADLERFAALVTSTDVVTALQDGTDCHQTADGSSWIFVDVAPGLRVRGSADCGGVIGALRDLAHALAAQLAGEESSEPVWPEVSATARIEATPTFAGLQLLRTVDQCSEGTSCSQGWHVTAEGFLGTGNRHGTAAADAMISFADVAIEDDLIAALMQDTPCPDDATATEMLTLAIGMGLELHADIAGCTEGPIAELRDATQELIDVYSEEPEAQP